MDNNFNGQQNQYQNQYQNQIPQQSVYQTNQIPPQYGVPNGNMMGNYQTAPNMMATVQQKPNIILGALGALGAAVLGTLLWIAIAAFTGYVIFLLAAGIAFLAMFLYEKLAKGIDIVGVIICVVFTCVAIYFGNRYGYICSVADELDCSISEAKVWFELACELESSYQFDYIKNMILSYVAGLGYTAAIFFKKK